MFSNLSVRGCVSHHSAESCIAATEVYCTTVKCIQSFRRYFSRALYYLNLSALLQWKCYHLLWLSASAVTPSTTVTPARKIWSCTFCQLLCDHYSFISLSSYPTWGALHTASTPSQFPAVTPGGTGKLLSHHDHYSSDFSTTDTCLEILRLQ